MRLLERQENNEFSLTKDLINDIPAYAILSHTWDGDDQEVTFNDVTKGLGKSKAGYQKIRFCGEQAARHGLRYFWIDTCCIDKSNHNELTEAINSMFRWYRESARCYVYLSDVSIHNSQGDTQSSALTGESDFRKCRWFSRGWTLQELIAPLSVIFFSREGIRLGDKVSLEEQINKITRIPIDALQGTPLSYFSVDDRILWAKNRKTTREEDEAYSLMGIFNIHMPLIYGEGRKSAFVRLYDEIDKRSKKKIAESKVSMASVLSTTLQQAPREQNNTITRSPDWLKPVVIMPSQDFKSNIRLIDPCIHRLVADVIFSNCRAACFGFYHANELWRTKYSRGDKEDEPKLFQLATGQFPKFATDLTLEAWLFKIRRAARWDEGDAIAAGDVYDFLGLGDLFSRMKRICSLLNYKSELDFENFEQNLLTSLELCRQLNGWDWFGRLKVLWEELHKPCAEKSPGLGELKYEFRMLMLELLVI